VLLHTLAHPGTTGALATLVALHGYRSHARDLIAMWPWLADGQLLMLCLQAPHRVTTDDATVVFAWSDQDREGSASARSIADSARLVSASIEDAVALYPIDPKRIALLGFGQGGMVAAHAGLAEPTRLAGLALLSTTLDEARAGDLTVSPQASQLPVLIQHGANDTTTPIVEAFSSVIRLQGHGVKAELQQFPMAAEISLESAAALSQWLTRVLGLES
jgi:phospholipase/carboxylesterase